MLQQHSPPGTLTICQECAPEPVGCDDDEFVIVFQFQLSHIRRRDDGTLAEVHAVHELLVPLPDPGQKQRKLMTANIVSACDDGPLAAVHAVHIMITPGPTARSCRRPAEIASNARCYDG